MREKNDPKIRARNVAIVQLSKFIKDNLYNTEWELLAGMAGVGHILDAHQRVTKAQRFGDSDYPIAISGFLQEVFNLDEQIGLFLVRGIIEQENPYDDPLTEETKVKLAQIRSGFEGDDSISFVSLTTSKFIETEVIWMPDDFYRRLIAEINRAYAYEMPMALSVTVRKLLENLVIDILRKKYSTNHLELYYDTSRRRFQSFSLLLDNLKKKKGEFHYISDSLNSDAIRTLEQYRGTGNAGAHSIDTNLTIEYFADKKDEINYLVNLLMRIFQRL